jgi:hypothetical protein
LNKSIEDLMADISAFADEAYQRGFADGKAELEQIKERLAKLFDGPPAKLLDAVPAPAVHRPVPVIEDAELVDCATLKPLTPIQAEVFSALKILLETGEAFSSARINELVGRSGAASQLYLIQTKGYIRNKGRNHAPEWKIVAVGEPRVEEPINSKKSLDREGDDKAAQAEAAARQNPVGEIEPVSDAPKEATVQRLEPSLPPLPRSLEAKTELSDDEDGNTPRPMAVLPKNVLRQVGEYLREENVRVEVLGIGRFRIGNDTMNHADLLEFANERRKRSGLAPISEKVEA